MKTCTFGRRNFLNLILAASALGCVTLGSAQMPSPASVARANQAKAVATAPGHAAALSAEKRTEEELPSKGLNTGVEVHGHWVIEVKNPDGRRVSHTEFENSYEGNTDLIDLLARQFVFGEWGVILGGPSTPCAAQITGPFGNAALGKIFISTTPPYCVISESGPMITQNCAVSSSQTDCSQNLQVGISTSTTSFTLGGSVISSQNGTVSQVESIVTSCPPSTAPAACATETVQNASGNSILGFTAATLPASASGQCGGANQPPCAIPVSGGQTIQAQVTITFH